MNEMTPLPSDDEAKRTVIYPKLETKTGIASYTTYESIELDPDSDEYWARW
jgi:hypothetical protein